MAGFWPISAWVSSGEVRAGSHRVPCGGGNKKARRLEVGGLEVHSHLPITATIVIGAAATVPAEPNANARRSNAHRGTIDHCRCGRGIDHRSGRCVNDRRLSRSGVGVGVAVARRSIIDRSRRGIIGRSRRQRLADNHAGSDAG